MSGPVLREARLIPVDGISGAAEAERRATSAFLAVLGIVRDLSVSLLTPFGAPRAQKAEVSTFAEVQYSHRGGTDRPDGLVQVTYGSKTWRALIEVKTKSDRLRAEQVNRYWGLAGREGINHLITISNEIAESVGLHPTRGLKVRSNSRVQISHLSWSEILLTAIRIREHTPVEDREQAWLLNELIRYLEHPASGVLAFEDMGPAWVTIRNGARDRSLHKRSDGLLDIVRRWSQMMRFVGLRLSSEVGENINVRTADEKTQVAALVDSGLLTAALHIPKTAGTLVIDADIRTSQVVTSMTVRAPEDKATKGRIGWLVNQIREAPAGLSLEAYPKNSTRPTTASLSEVRDDWRALVGDPPQPAYRLRVLDRKKMGAGRKSGPASKSFIGSVFGAVESFYENVVQQIDEWRPPVPQRKALPQIETLQGDTQEGK